MTCFPTPLASLAGCGSLLLVPHVLGDARHGPALLLAKFAHFLSDYNLLSLSQCRVGLCEEQKEYRKMKKEEKGRVLENKEKVYKLQAEKKKEQAQVKMGLAKLD